MNLTFGERVLLLRRRRQLTAVALARAAGCDPKYLSRLERGEIRTPGTGLVVALAKALEVSVEFLWEGAPLPPPE